MGKAHSKLNTVRVFFSFFQESIYARQKSDIPDWALKCSKSKVCRPAKLGLTKLHSNKSYEEYLKAESRDFGNEIGDFDI